MMKMRKATVAVIAFLSIAATTSAVAHEMFLKAPNSVVAPNSDAVVRLINGTFDKSENSISQDRIANVSIVTNDGVTNPPDSAWRYDENSSYLDFRTGEAGTYVIGVSTRPNIIAMSPDDFVAYLKHDGVLDTLTTFEQENALTEVRERYSKHVRTVIQVGDKKTAAYAKPLNYPVEILLDQNPYDLRFGDDLSFRVLVNGEPAAHQIVRASYEGFHGHDASGGHINSYNLRTDKDGRAGFLLSNKALWYISLINMQKIDDPEADYESNWATITFLVN